MKILLVAYDNDSFLHYFQLGLGYLASVLKKEGHDVEIYQQDVHHYDEAHLTALLDRNRYDMVGIGVIGGYYQYGKLLRISDAVNKSKEKPVYVIGGHGPSPEPEYFLRKTGADAAVIGEGERTITELCRAIEDDKPWDKVNGIAYIDKGSGLFVKTPERQLIKEVDAIPKPAWDLFKMDYYTLYRFPNVKHNQRSFPILSGRGCPFKCNFCYRMDKGFRQRSSGSILEEIGELKNRYNVTYISFSDELLMSSESRTMELCEKFLESGLGFDWYCNGRLNFASQKVLKIMKKAGCVFINYGIEAMDDEVLKKMNKNLTTEQIVKGVKNTLDVGISPGLNIIFGHIGDNLKTLKKDVDFLIKYGDGSQLRTIRPVTPYPGSPLYYYAIENELLRDCADFYENKHINSDLLAVNFTDLSDADFHGALLNANRRLIKDYFCKQAESVIGQAERLYLKRDTTFRGFR